MRCDSFDFGPRIEVRSVMCSEYSIKTDPSEIATALGVPIANHVQDFEWGKTVKFFTSAPVIQKNGNKFELALRIFPKSPMPNSRLSGLEGQTEDSLHRTDPEHAQVKRIYDVKTWKTGFETDPVIIPMSDFTEFAYWGPEKGTAQTFKIPHEKVLFAAGIGIKPHAPKGEPGSAFSILTHTATPQMLEYHFRLIVLLEARQALLYLDDMTPEERFDFLIENRYTGKFLVRKTRNMAKGWEKRTDLQLHKLKNEMRYRDILKANDVAG